MFKGKKCFFLQRSEKMGDEDRQGKFAEKWDNVNSSLTFEFDFKTFVCLKNKFQTSCTG